MTNPASEVRPENPYVERQLRIRAAMTAWSAERDFGQATADDLDDFLNEEGLQILPRVATSGSWRVIVDDKPAPSVFNADRPSGVLDADEAADVFLSAVARDARDTSDKQIVVRPATEREMVGQLSGDDKLYGPRVTVQADAWTVPETAPEARGDRRKVVLTDGKGRVVEIEFDREALVAFAESLADAAEQWEVQN